MRDIKEITGEIDKIEGVNISSINSYFEIFSHCPNKLQLNIAPTATIKDNEVKDWVFTKKKNPCRVVRKSEEKMNLKEMFYKFTGIRIDDYSLRELREIPKSIENCAAVTFVGMEKFVVNIYELKFIIENSIDKVKRIQQMVNEYQPRKYLNPKNLPNEILYCFAKKEEEHMPFTLKFFKKCINYDAMKGPKINTLFEIYLGSSLENQNIDLSDVKAFLLSRKYTSSNVNKVYYKSFDSHINQKIEQTSRKLLEFMESEFRIQIKHFFIKFLVDSAERVVFLGGKDLLLFPLKPRPGLDWRVLEDINRPGPPIPFNEFIKDVGYPYPQLSLTYKKVEMPDETIKVFSDKLFNNMITQSCPGEFCKYVITLHISLFDGKTKALNEIPNKSKILGKLQSKNLPFKIPYSLIKNVFDNKELAIGVLDKHKVYPPCSVQTIDYVPKREDYNFRPPRLLVNHQTLYSMASVCPKCLQIYTLLSKELQCVLFTAMKPNTSPNRKKWTHSEVRLNNNVKSSQALYPPVQAGEGQSARETEAQIHHNVGLFLQHNQKLPGIKPLPAVKTVPDSNSNKESLPKLVIEKDNSVNVNKTETQNINTSNLVPGLPKKRDSKNLRIQVLASSAGLPKVHAETARQSSSDFIRRMSLGLASRPDGLSSRRSSIKVDDFTEHNPSTMSQRKSSVMFRPSSGRPSRPGSGRPSPVQVDFSNMSFTNSKNILSARYGKEARKTTSGALTPRRQASISVEQRDKIKQKVIDGITKNLEKTHRHGSIAQDLFNVKKNLYESKKGDIGIPLSIFHYKYHNIRKIPIHRITAPKQNLNLDEKLSQALQHPHIVDFSSYRRIGEFSHPPISYEDISEMFGYFHDNTLAIPFMILQSNDISPDEPLNITVVCHDFFDNFMSYIEVYKKALKGQTNKRFILLNFPCQAYTLFPDDYVPTNESCSEVIDGLMFRLEESGVFDLEKDEFSFIGYGYGGNILLCFLTSLENSIPSYRNLLLVNSFSYIDDMLANTVQEMKQAFDESPDDIPELPYDFYAYLVQTKDYGRKSKEMAQNPITKLGRIKICDGCLNSFNVRNKIANLQMHKSVIHSMNNCLVNVSHADILATNEDERYGTKKNAVVEMYFKKNSLCIKGGHAVLKENLEEFAPALSNFVKNGLI